MSRKNGVCQRRLFFSACAMAAMLSGCKWFLFDTQPAQVDVLYDPSSRAYYVLKILSDHRLMFEERGVDGRSRINLFVDGVAQGKPRLVRDGNALYGLVHGIDGQIYQRVLNDPGSSWQSPAPLVALEGPEAVRQASGVLRVFARGANHTIYSRQVSPPTAWAPVLGGDPFVVTPAVISLDDGRLIVMETRSYSGELVFARTTPEMLEAAQEWHGLGIVSSTRPAMVPLAGGTLLDTVVLATDRKLYRRTILHDDATPTPWAVIGEGYSGSSPSVAVVADHLEIFARGDGITRPADHIVVQSLQSNQDDPRRTDTQCAEIRPTMESSDATTFCRHGRQGAPCRGNARTCDSEDLPTAHPAHEPFYQRAIYEAAARGWRLVQLGPGRIVLEKLMNADDVSWGPWHVGMHVPSGIHLRGWGNDRGEPTLIVPAPSNAYAGVPGFTGIAAMVAVAAARTSPDPRGMDSRSPVHEVTVSDLTFVGLPTDSQFCGIQGILANSSSQVTRAIGVATSDQSVHVERNNVYHTLNGISGGTSTRLGGKRLQRAEHDLSGREPLVQGRHQRQHDMSGA